MTVLTTLVWIACGAALGQPVQAKLDVKDIDFFESKIRPVLVEHCYRCHSEEARKKGKLKADLLLDTRAGLLKGGVTGTALVAGKPDASLLFKALRHEGELQMPPSGKLSPALLSDFEAWIKRGAPDPRDGKEASTVAAGIDWDKARQFWAFQPPRKHPLPRVADAAWPRRDIDHFILAELEKRKLKRAAPAGKRELIRRASFDLIGLPPTPDEVDAFLKDESPDAFARVVDRLLLSPHYGERWARYWLDIARYAEDKALAFVNTRPHAYRYRDWVVQAFNRDMPYDRFVRLQVAGDLVNDPEPDHFTKLAGLGFQGLGHEYHRGSVAAQVIADELDDRIDTLSRGLLGLTVACARCHDHKYDPIPARDYYSLAASYNGSNLTVLPLADKAVVEKRNAYEKTLMEAEGKLNQWVKEQSQATIEAALAETGRYMESAWQVVVLNKKKIAVDPVEFARRENLHVLFVERTVKFLEEKKFDKQDAALKAWLAVMEKLDPVARPLAGSVAIPPELRKASEILQSEVKAALREKGKGPLLKTLALDANSPFFVRDNERSQFLSESGEAELAKRQAEVERLRKAAPPAPPLAHGISGGGAAMRVYLRGNVERVGEPAPPGFLRVLAQGPLAGSDKFTRSELAEAIASVKNPLTARVFVNRVWHYHFGRGIVGTPSNFGQVGDRPTHPELLDTLAVRFMEAGWSTRWLHREMMLSSAYQLASSNDPSNAEQDPDNQYLWRYTPRRLDFEAWRDSWLAVSGRLDPTLGGLSLELAQTNNVRRTIYAKVSRVEADKLLILFDFPDANVTSDRRTVTTVPQQQLFVLNGDFTIETAKAFAKRLEKDAPQPEQRIGLAFRLTYGREPSPVELEASLGFIRDAGKLPGPDRLGPWEQFAQAVLASNEFMWVD